MAQLELVTMNPPTGEGYEGLEPIRVPVSSVRAWTKRGWTLVEDTEETPQATAAQGSTQSTEGSTPAPTASTQRTNKPSTAAPETTSTP